MSELFYKAAGAILAPFRYAEREVKHMKENVKEDLQEKVASIINLVIAGVAGLLFLLFISITGALALNNATNTSAGGFAIVAGIYLIVAVVFFMLKMSADKKHKIAHEERKTSHI